jgi:hypothetical protein
MSSWPISIGTALSFETLRIGPNPVYDPERPIPKGTDITKYDSFWINLKTLYRNILSALPAQSQEGVMAGECLYALEYEVEIIREIVADITRGAITPTFYTSGYEDLAKEHPHALLRVYNTPKQQAYHAQEEIVIREFHKRHGQKEGVFYVKRKIVPTTPTRGLILSHCAYDLLNVRYFTDLELLESHTGVVKNKSQWYTKLQTAKDQASIPFNCATLQVFGDSLLFQPFPIAQRKELIATAIERKWTAITSLDRLRLSLDLMGNQELASKLKEMLREDV